MKRNAINTLYNIIRIQMFTVCTTPPPAKKHGVVQRLKPAKSNIYARPRAGLLFCLASAEGAGLFFLPGGVSATHKRVYSGLFVFRAIYTATEPKPFTGLYSGVSVDLPYSIAHNTAVTQAAYAPPVPRRMAYHQAQHPHRYQTPPPNRDAVQVSTAVYYNKVYKGAGVRPCRGSMPDSATHRRPCQPGSGAVQQQGHGGRNNWRLPPLLFSGFRPIANRGQQ